MISSEILVGLDGENYETELFSKALESELLELPYSCV